MRTNRAKLRLKIAGMIASVVLAILGLVISTRIAQYIFILGVAALALLVGWEGFSRLSRHRLRRRRGVASLGYERMRDNEFAQVWRSAKAKILCSGVGMTGITQEEDLIRQTVRRGVEVEFVMIDPGWLSQNSQVSDLVDDFYNKENFYSSIKKSLEDLEILRDELNGEFGAEKVRIQKLEGLVLYSGTIADYGTIDAHGYIEFHLYRSPLGRFRMHVEDYRDHKTSDPSLIYHWLASLSRMVGRDYVGPLRSVPLARPRPPTKALSVANDTLVPDGKNNTDTERQVQGENA